MLKSTDSGTSWTITSQGLPIMAIAVDPVNTTKVYAGASSGVLFYDYQ